MDIELELPHIKFFMCANFRNFAILADSPSFSRKAVNSAIATLVLKIIQNIQNKCVETWSIYPLQIAVRAKLSVRYLNTLRVFIFTYRNLSVIKGKRVLFLTLKI